MDSYPWLEPTWIDPPTFSSMAGSGAASGIGIRITGSVSSWSGFGAPVWGMPGLPLMPLAIVFNSLQYGFDKTIQCPKMHQHGIFNWEYDGSPMDFKGYPCGTPCLRKTHSCPSSDVPGAPARWFPWDINHNAAASSGP